MTGAGARPRPAPIRARARQAAGATAAIVAAWSAYALSRPFSFDQGVFSWIGGVILGGGLPYRDAWDTKGPLAYYLAALASLLFGRNEWGFRAFDLLVLFAGAAGLAAVARRCGGGGGRAAPFAAAGLLLLWYGGLDYHNTAQPDGWAAMMLVAAAWATSRVATARGAGRRAGWFAAAGAIVGLTALVKPTYGLFLLGPAAYAAAQWRGDGRAGRTVAAWVSTGAGFVVPVAAAALWFAGHRALGDLVSVHLWWTTHVYVATDGPWLVRVETLASSLLTGKLVVALPLVAVGAVTLLRRSRPNGWLTLGWVAAGLGGVLVQGKLFPYHWLPLFPPLALLAGLGVAEAYHAARDEEAAMAAVVGGAVPGSERRWRMTQLLFFTIGAAVWCSAALTPAYDVYRWGKLLVGARDRSLYWQREYGLDGWQSDSWHGIVRYLTARTARGDAVVLLGGDPSRVALAGRRFPGRLGIAIPLILGGETGARAAYRREFLQALQATPPVYVVRAQPAACESETWAGYHCVDDFPELDSLLAHDYHRETTIAGRDVLRRDASPSPAAVSSPSASSSSGNP